MDTMAKEKECARLVKAAMVKSAKQKLGQAITGWHWYDFRKWWYQPKGAPYLDTRSMTESNPKLHRLAFHVALWIIMTPISLVLYYLGKAFIIITNSVALAWTTLLPIKTQHSPTKSLVHLWGLYSTERRRMNSGEHQLLLDWINVLYGERGASINLRHLDDEFSNMEYEANHDYYTGKSSTHVYFGNPTDYLIREVSESLGSYTQDNVNLQQRE